MCLALLASGSATQAGVDKFSAGTAIPECGPKAKVDSMLPIPKDMKFKIAFDMSQSADVALSAMTAHGIWALQGVSQNPF